MANPLDRNIQISSAGQAIRSLRVAQKLSLHQLADRIGWDKARLSKYENNKLGLSLAVIEELATGLECEPLFLVLTCLKHRYPELSRKGSKIGHTLDKLVRQLSA